MSIYFAHTGTPAKADSLELMRASLFACGGGCGGGKAGAKGYCGRGGVWSPPRSRSPSGTPRSPSSREAFFAAKVLDLQERLAPTLVAHSEAARFLSAKKGEVEGYDEMETEVSELV